jgi:spore germination protein KB
MTVLEGGKISGRQFMGVLIVLRTVPLTLVFSLISNINHVQDAWIAAIIGTAIAIPFAVLVTKLSLRFPGKTIIEYSQSLLGPVVGRLLGIMILWCFFCTSVDITRGLGEAYVIAIMPETPILAFMIMLVFMSCYAARSGLEVTCRLGEDVFYILVFVLLLTCTLPYNAMRFENLMPILARGISNLISPTVASLGYYGQYLIIGMLVPYLNKPEDATRYAVYAVLISGALIALAAVALVAVFGTTASSWTLPLFSLARMISLGEFFERIEAAVMAAWTLSIGIKLALFLWAASVAIAQLVNLKAFEHLVYPLGAITVAAGLSFFESMVDLEDFLAKASAMASILVAGVTLLLLYAALEVRMVIYRRKGGSG